jgi:hypothetical protein
MIELNQMPRFFALLTGCCYAGLLLAQPATDLFDKAPPAVEEALKVRLATFLDAQMAKKYRLADDMVAEDSKDAFFGADKLSCKSWQYVKATFTDQFTKANVLFTCDALMSHAGQHVPVKIPMSSTWKIVDGQWFWYLVPSESVQTPWGTMKGGPDKDAKTPAANAFKIPKPEEIFDQIKLSKATVDLSGFRETSDEVTVTNGTPGKITLDLQHDTLAGLEASLDRKELKPGESATVSVKFKPAGRIPQPVMDLGVRVEPFNHLFNIRIRFEGMPAQQRAK